MLGYQFTGQDGTTQQLPFKFDKSDPSLGPVLSPTDDDLRQLNTQQLTDRLTNYDDVPSDRAAAILSERLQEDSNTSSFDSRGAMLANDVANTLSKISLNPADWAKGISGMVGGTGAAVHTVFNALGSQQTQDFRSDLDQQLAQGHITQQEHDTGISKLNQIDDIKSNRALVGPGGGLGETAQHLQDISDENKNVSQLFFQADPSFARSQASKALMETYTGTENSLQEILHSGKSLLNWDPRKYLTGRSQLLDLSPQGLTNWIDSERLFNVQRLQHAQGNVDPWTQAIAKSNIELRKDYGLLPQYADPTSPEELEKMGRPVDPNKVMQVSGAAQLLEAQGLSKFLGLPTISQEASTAALKTAAAGVKASVPVATAVSKAIKNPLVRNMLSIPAFAEMLHGNPIGAAWAMADDIVGYGAAYAGEKWGPMAAEMFERAAENNYKGGGFLSQGVSRGIRLSSDALSKSFPYALMTSGGDPGQFFSNLSSMAGVHMALGAPGWAKGTLGGGEGDWIWARDGNVKQVAPQNYTYDPELTRSSNAQINNLPANLRNIVTRTQDVLKDHTDLYVVSPQVMQDYQGRFGADAMQTPNGFWVGPERTGTGRAAAFIDSGHINEAFAHESMGHSLFWLMKDADRESLRNSAVSEGDPDKFIRDNYGQNVSYASLPDKPDPANPQGLSKRMIATEMAVEEIGRYWNGGSIEQFYKDKPGLARSLRYSSGKILDRLGIPSKTFESTSSMGINPAFANSVLIDGYYRELANNRLMRPLPDPTWPIEWPRYGETYEQTTARQAQRMGASPGGGGATTVSPPAAPTQGPAPVPQTPPGTTASPEIKAAVVSGLQGMGIKKAQAKALVEQAQGATEAELLQDALRLHATNLGSKVETRPGPTVPVVPPQALPATPQSPPSQALPATQPQPTTSVGSPATQAKAPTTEPAESTPEQHAQIEKSIAKGTPAGEAQAAAEGRPPTTLSQEGKPAPPQYMPKKAVAAPGKAGTTLTVPVTGQQQKEPTGSHRLVEVIGSEFGETDNPQRGGYSEPNWDRGAWGADLRGERNEGVALPTSILRHLGYKGQKGFDQLFNNQYVVRIHNPRTGAVTEASLKDLGPKASTGALIDMLWGTRTKLGFGRNFKGAVNFEILNKKDGSLAYAPTGREVDEGFRVGLTESGHRGLRGLAPGGGESTWSGFGTAPPAPTYGVPVPGIREAEEEGTTAPVSAAAPEPLPTVYPSPFVGQYPFGIPTPSAMIESGAPSGASPIGPIAPGAPTIGFQPRKPKLKLGGVTPEEEEEGPVESTLGNPNVPGFEHVTDYLKKGNREATLAAQHLHAATLSPDDTRVKKQADKMFKGEHFVKGDPLHAQMLANTPKNERLALAAGQTAIANKLPMHITYASAPPTEEKESPITRASREVNYEESSPQARLLGQTNARLSGHSFIPTAVGISLAKKKGAENNGYIQGISTNVAAHNHYHLNKALSEMGEESPYPELDSRFRNDLSGYVQNLLAGHRGTGTEYAPGTKEYPAAPDLDYVPYRLSRRKADFLNAVINNQAARHQPALRTLARRGGTLLTEEGETNPFRHAIDEIHDKGIKDASEDRWSKGVLEPTIRSFNAGLIHALHAEPREIPEAIRPKVPGFGELTRTLGTQLGGEKGRPDILLPVNFMPRKPGAEPLSPDEHRELTANIRKKYIAGAIDKEEFLKRIGQVPGPGEELGPMFQPKKPNKAESSEDVPFKDLSPKAQKAYVAQRVKDRLDNQIEGAVPLRPALNENGSYQHDEFGNPKWQKDQYKLVNMPILGEKGLQNAPKDIKKTGEDIYSKDEHKHLNDIDRKRLSWLEQQSAVDTLSDKIIESYQNQMQHVSEVMAAKGWYTRMTEKLKKAFGPDFEIFAQLLGATSARTGVHQNFIQALDAYDQLKKGNFDNHIEKYLEAHEHLTNGTLRGHMMDLGIHKGFDEKGKPITDAAAMAHWIARHDILPKQKSGQKFNANSNQVLKVLAKTWLTSVKAPKTPNFAGNLSGRTREATIDVWAARFLHELGNEGNKEPWLLQPGGEGGVKGLDFAFAQRAFRKAADKMGLNPDDLQAIAWYHQKHLWDQRGYTKGQGKKKASFDETFDKIFKPTGERMSDEEARAAFAGEKDEEPEEEEED
jgi:hypothetical protein